tara:strand:+ start:1622 stop:2689 length:1068 start_codon:yes stop_codon:yes gene_type:complete
MASRRFYAYYVRGGQIAIVEYDNVSGAGQTLGQPSLDDIGPSGTLAWKSPIATISDGLEIEYTYSQKYGLINEAEIEEQMDQKEKLISSGWFVDGDGYLNFLTNTETLTSDVRAVNSEPWSTFLTFTTPAEYIVIRNSSRWNGVHRLKSTGGANGYFQTETVPGGSYGTGTFSGLTYDIYLHSDGYISADAGTEIWVNKIVSTGDFVWLAQAPTGDEGLYEVTSITEVDAGTEIQQKAFIGTKYFLNAEDDLDEFQSGDSHLDTATTAEVFKVVYDPCYVTGGVNVLDSESDTIDLPEYLSKALVYYVKAKMAEDLGDIEQKEYNIKEFHRIIEKHESSKIWGSRMIVPGPSAIR